MNSKSQWESLLTDRAQKIVDLASAEAQRMKHAVVRGEHLLWGMIKDGGGVAVNVLKNLNVDLPQLEKAVKEKLDADKVDVDELEQQLDATEECLKTACEEAKALEHDKVGTEDILLGILKDTQGFASEVLSDFGVKFDAAKQEVQKVIEKAKEAVSNGARGSEEVGQMDLSERGRSAEGKPISFDRRLFMQFTAYQFIDASVLADRFRENKIQAVIYQDLNDYSGIGVLSFCEDPNYLVDQVQPVIASMLNEGGEQKEEFTMLGRTYSIGYENDLEEVLLNRPAIRACDQTTPWAVFYPVRRSGMFERESKEEQRKMLMEHGGIGHAFGKAGFATDIRLAAHGLNTDDNDFIIGLLGKELFPLSALVQKMRRTRQTSEFIDSMGPFFVGKAIYQPEYQSFENVG